MHIMKEDKVLPGLPPEEMEWKLCREAGPEGAHPLHTTLIALPMQPHKPLYLEPTE